METVRLTFEPFPGDDVRKFVTDGVDNFNIAATGLPAYFPVNFLLRGEDGDILGGLLGQLWGGWLQISYLWVAETVRGQGHGFQLVQAAEDYARRRGAIGATLETHSFQARPFYERLGYTMFGALDGYPPGHAKFFLSKRLDIPPTAS
jgi:GNAT superfamily N-acetyltransferase